MDASSQTQRKMLTVVNISESSWRAQQFDLIQKNNIMDGELA